MSLSLPSDKLLEIEKLAVSFFYKDFYGLPGHVLFGQDPIFVLMDIHIFAEFVMLFRAVCSISHYLAQ